MANIVRKPNGTYLIRISAGKDDRGKPVTVSRTFTPSEPTLSYLSLQKEMNLFIENLQVQILNGEILDANGRKIAPNSPGKTLFRDFCEKFLEIKASEIAPGTLAFYRQIIQTHLIPTYGMMRPEEFRVRHVQDYIQFVMAKGRQDIHHPGEQMAAATVKRYATVFRSILSLAYQNSLLYEYYLPPKLTKKIRKFQTNISGISIENIINSMIGAKECDNSDFLNANNRKLKIVGKLPSEYEEIPVVKREDGTLKSLDPQYEEYIRAVNETSNVIRSGIVEVIDFIREKIFSNKEIRTQEIFFTENRRVLALCDLSSDDAVLEIKTFDIFNSYKTKNVIRQMYYQKGDKELYAMSIIFDFSYAKKMERRLDNLIFRIYKVEISHNHRLSRWLAQPYKGMVLAGLKAHRKICQPQADSSYR